ncbi:MAG: hypothetical protein NZ920_04250 [Aigarchaeota archaeon]|nr:hypothetical protein [Aigarchaeota archaeon]MDW8092167.1 hypothetical protein [Nitrososphaerota archaeon]
MRETKYLVEVQTSEKPAKIDKSLLESLKGAVSNKQISAMRREYISCPVINQNVAFLLCFNCVSFIRRVSGQVHCEGIEYKVKV